MEFIFAKDVDEGFATSASSSSSTPQIPDEETIISIFPCDENHQGVVLNIHKTFTEIHDTRFPVKYCDPPMPPAFDVPLVHEIHFLDVSGKILKSPFPVGFNFKNASIRRTHISKTPRENLLYETNRNKPIIVLTIPPESIKYSGILFSYTNETIVLKIYNQERLKFDFVSISRKNILSETFTSSPNRQSFDVCCTLSPEVFAKMKSENLRLRPYFSICYTTEGIKTQLEHIIQISHDPISNLSNMQCCSYFEFSNNTNTEFFNARVSYIDSSGVIHSQHEIPHINMHDSYKIPISIYDSVKCTIYFSIENSNPELKGFVAPSKHLEWDADIDIPEGSYTVLCNATPIGSSSSYCKGQQHLTLENFTSDLQISRSYKMILSSNHLEDIIEIMYSIVNHSNDQNHSLIILESIFGSEFEERMIVPPTKNSNSPFNFKFEMKINKIK